MKSKYRKKLLLLIICIMTLSLSSCTVMKRFNSKDINNFLDDYSDKYAIVDKTKVEQSHGDLFIHIYFTSEADVDLDESMYEDIKTFFMQVDVQERIMKKMNKSPDDYTYYPSIDVWFDDSNEIETHSIESVGKMFKFGSSNYSQWSEPYFSNKGYQIIGERASTEVVEARAKMYDDIKKTIFDNDEHRSVGIIYNFGSLKDENVVLNIHFNSNDDDYDKLTKIWHTKYDEVYNLVIKTLDLKYYMNGNKVTFEEDHSNKDKYVFCFREDIKDGLIVSDYYMLDKKLLENEITLINNVKYRLILNYEGTNKLISYRIEEVEQLD